MNSFRELGTFVLVAVLGYISWKVPSFAIPHFYGETADPADISLFRFGLLLPLLVGVGVIAGLLDPKHWLSNGAATMLLVLLVDVVEAVFLGSHQMLGLEMIVYAILSIPGIVGAFLGKRIPRRHSGL